MPIRDARTTALILVDLQHGVLALLLTPHHAADVVGRAVELGGALVATGGTRVVVNLDDAVVIAADACSSVAPDLHAFAITRILP